jgi:hypothetical protein
VDLASVRSVLSALSHPQSAHLTSLVLHVIRWIAPRDLCLLRYWRRTEDGSYVICLQSTVHPECPSTHVMVRAKCNGGGFIISPRGQVTTAQPDELSSLVTHVVHMDPLGYDLSGQLMLAIGKAN